ncbi:hypothetical protein Taro_040689 [Colocasia esculenta]|uniref:Uncharacterized protein n=1 Tax=Colocasia esculenta TaxID=4460 RepID=A0A843WVA5_COLES|nr:hypothetical protein [Colocasia esculenta]
MFGHPYPRPGEKISRRVEHDFRSLSLNGSACGLRQRFALRPRSRRGIWAPNRKSPNATIYRPGRSADY